MNIRGWNVRVVRVELPWGGAGWMADLDFVRPGLRAYHELRRRVIEGAKMDIDDWNATENARARRPSE